MIPIYFAVWGKTIVYIILDTIGHHLIRYGYIPTLDS